MSASSITRLASKILSRNETSLTVAELQQGAAAVQARLASGGIDANKRVHCPDGRCSMNLGPSAASISFAAPSPPSSFSLASLLPRGGKCTPLALAILAGDLALVDVLLANGADPNKLSGLPHRFDFAPLHLAAALGSAAAVAKLLAAGADANARLDKCRGLAPKQEAALAASLKSTAAGDTALHLALDCTVSAAACCEVVKALLAHPGTNPNTRNHAGLTPLTVACKRKREDVVDLLLGVMTPSPPPSSAASLPPHGGGAGGGVGGGLDSPYAGAHPRLDLNASGPLFAAIAAEDAGLVRKLLVAGAGVRHARNEEGLSPLAYAVCRVSTTFTNRAEVVSLLLAAGAPVESGLLQHAAEWPHVREALAAAAGSSRLSAGSSSGTGSGSGSLRGSSTGYVGIAAGGSKRFDRGSQGYTSAGGIGGGASSRASADGAAGLATGTGTGAGHTAAAAAAASPGAPPAVVMGLPLSPAVSTAPLITATTSSDTSTSSGTVQRHGRFSFLSALAPGLGLSGRGPGGSCCLPPPPFSASSGILRAMQKNVCCSLMFFPMLLPVLVMALFIDALMPVAAALCSFLRIAVPIIALLCVLVLYGVIHLALQAAAPLLSTLSAAAAAAGTAVAGTAVAPPPGLAAELAAGAGAGAGAGVVVLGATEAGLEALGHAAGSAGLAVVSVLEHEVEAAASLVVNNLSNYVAAATAGSAPASASASLSGLAAVAAAASKALTGAVSAVLAALLPCGLASAAGGRTLGLDLWRWQGPLGLGAGLAAWFLGVVAAHALLGLAEEALVGYRPPGDRLRAFLQHRAAARHAGGGAISDEQLAAHARLCLPVALLLGGGTGVKLMPLTVLMVLLCLPTVAVSVRKEYERGLWQQQKQPATAAAAAGVAAGVAAGATALKAQGAVQATTQAQVQFVGLEKAGLGQRARR